ncbi:MAG: sulfatase [Actinobacteria bacterium]|nr:sulfatase [Actinomycetota bacterium]
MVVVFLLAGCSGSETFQEKQVESPTDRPNIILILTDDLDFASAQKMPQIRSQLIEEGTSFENAFVSYPLCCPSRATILTGLYAHNHNVKGNTPAYGGFQKFLDEGHEENTVAVRLQESGYQTAYFGKYLNGYPGEEDPAYVPPGWDEWHALGVENKYSEYDLNENGEVVSYGKRPKDYLTDVLSSKAMEYVQGTTDHSEPFFMHLSPHAPHLPASPAKRHRNAFAEEAAPRPPSFNEEDVSDKPLWIKHRQRISEEEVSNIDTRYRRRLESMLAVDEMVASLIQELEAAGKLDNTVIFFTSDNGWEQGEHRIHIEKSFPYEESAHVPFFVRGPGISSDSKVEKLALNTDLASTFAELAGVNFSGDGRSLVPLLRGEDPQWRSNILLEGFGEYFSDGSAPPAYEAVRTDSHKYIEYINGERELYDVEADPYELENVHDSADPSLIENLKTKLDALRNCAAESCREAEDSP